MNANRAAALRAVMLSCALGCSATAAPVVVLVESGASMYQRAAQGFQERFGDPGQLEVFHLSGDSREFSDRLAPLRNNSPRLVVALGTQVARVAKEQLPGIPLLYCLALSPLQNGLSGLDIGGVALEVRLPQQIAAIQRALPQVRRIGVVYDEPASGRLVRQARQLLKGQVELVARDARSPREAAQAIQQLQGKVDAFWLLWDPVVLNPANFRVLVDFSLKNKVKLIAPAPAFVETGALLSVAADPFKAGRQAGEMARQILDGKVRAGSFAAVSPEDLVLTINGEVARRLGVTFPPNLPAEILAPRDER